MPRFSSILSAYGIACADITAEASRSFIGSFSASDLFDRLKLHISELRAEVQAHLAEQDVSGSEAVYEVNVG